MRHARVLRGRRLLSLLLGLALVAVAVIVPTALIRAHSQHASARPSLAHATADQRLLSTQIAAGLRLNQVPSVLIPALPDIATSPLAPELPPACQGTYGTSIPSSLLTIPGSMLTLFSAFFPSSVLSVTE